MLNLLPALLKSGVKTSEFYVAMLALLLPYIIDLPSDRVASWTAAHGWIGGLVAAVYIAARAYVKRGQIAALGEPALADAQAGHVLEVYGGGTATPATAATAASLADTNARMEIAAPPGWGWDKASARYIKISG